MVAKSTARQPATLDPLRARSWLKPGSVSFLRQLLVALQASGRRQASHEFLRHAHLIDYARQHPLTFDDTDAPAKPRLRNAGWASRLEQATIGLRGIAAKIYPRSGRRPGTSP